MSSLSRPAPRRPSDRRARSIIPSILLVMLALMIVRDLLARRWSAERRPLPDVTRRSL
jgi:hypothetical protein